MTAIEEMENDAMAELMAKVFADSADRVQEEIPDIVRDLERFAGGIEKD